MLAAAPWVLTRGNHELCQRGGQGWFRLLDPHPAAACAAMTEPYTLDLGPLHLLMFDSADADDAQADAAKVAAFRPQLQHLLEAAPPHAWLVTHRPVWAVAEGEGVPAGATLNATEQAALRGLGLAPLDMVLSGHIHDFASYAFGPGSPAQLVVGEGGDANDEIVQPVRPGITIDGMTLRRGFTLSDYGYLLLHRTPSGWSGTVYSINDAILARCRLHNRDITCRAADG